MFFGALSFVKAANLRFSKGETKGEISLKSNEDQVDIRPTFRQKNEVSEILKPHPTAFDVFSRSPWWTGIEPLRSRPKANI